MIPQEVHIVEDHLGNLTAANIVGEAALHILLRCIIHSLLTDVCLIVPLQALPFLHLLILLRQYTARTTP